MPFVKPAYTYDERATLARLLEEFLAKNGGRRAAVARAIGARDSLFDQWASGDWTDGLRGRYLRAFQEVTGIDLERLMVLDAKRNVWTNDPATRAFVTLDRFPTRGAVVEEIRRAKALPLYDGTRLIAWQLGVNEDLVNRWTVGDADKPNGKNLEASLVGLSRGLIESGTRNDLAMRLAVRRVCGVEPEECLGLSTFQALVDEVLTARLRACSSTIVAQQVGINRSTTESLLEWRPENPIVFSYGTIFALVRQYVHDKWDVSSCERFERTVAEFLDKGNKAYVVREPVFPEGKVPSVVPGAPSVQENSSVRVEDSAPKSNQTAQRTETTADERAASASVVRRLSEHLREQLLGLARDFPDETGKLPLSPSLEIGETVHDVRWCLTGANMPVVGDWNPSDQEIEPIVEATALLRRALLIVLGLPMPARRCVIDGRLARELDELFLAFDHAGVEDLLGFAEQIRLQRQQAGIVRGRV